MVAYGPRGDQPERPSAGGRVLSLTNVTTPGSGQFVGTKPSYVDAWLYGGGASGMNGAAGGFTARGGASGGGVYVRFPLLEGQTVSYVLGAGGAGQASPNSIGNSGADSTLTLPSGLVVLAGGGKNDGTGGVAVGGNINRPGWSSVTTDTSSGAAGASFSDVSFLLSGGSPSAYNSGLNGGDPSAGSGGSSGAGSGRGGNGKLFYIITAR